MNISSEKGTFQFVYADAYLSKHIIPDLDSRS